MTAFKAGLVVDDITPASVVKQARIPATSQQIAEARAAGEKSVKARR
jgi:hypothetical protein